MGDYTCTRTDTLRMWGFQTLRVSLPDSSSMWYLSIYLYIYIYIYIYYTHVFIHIHIYIYICINIQIVYTHVYAHICIMHSHPSIHPSVRPSIHPCMPRLHASLACIPASSLDFLRREPLAEQAAPALQGSAPVDLPTRQRKGLSLWSGVTLQASLALSLAGCCGRVERFRLDGGVAVQNM